MTQDNKLHPRNSYSFNDEKIEVLREVVPEAFVDGKIDWDVLRDILGDHIEDDSIEHFGLTWPGKREARRRASFPSPGTLVPVDGAGVNEDDTHNIFIESDNLEALKLLQKSYAGRIKMIYIDPPYNTGNDFVYRDDFKESSEEYMAKSGQMGEAGELLTSNPKTSGRYHTNWLNMMYSRLRLARNLLRDDGVIFVSIDQNELHNLIALMNEVFGEENYISCIANVNNPKGRSDDKYIATAHEYLLVYSRSSVTTLGGWEPGERVTRRYNKLDNKGKKYREIDLRKTGDADRREDRPEMFYYFIFDEVSGEFYPTKDIFQELDDKTIIKPLRADGTEGRWRWGIDTAISRIDELKPKLMPNRGDYSVFQMDYLEDKDAVKPTSAWTKKAFNSERGSEQFIELGFDKNVFPRPKPVGLLKHIIQIGMDSDNNDIILDFFGGSGTTAQAVFEYNVEDGGNRQFILIQLNEPTDKDSTARKEGFKTISKIAQERIRRVISRIQEEGADKLPLDEMPDLGFKVFKYTSSHYRPWQDYDGEEIEVLQDMFSQSPLVDNWETDGLLTEILLLNGFPLDSHIEILDEYDTNTVYRITSGFHEHALHVCLDEKIVDATIRNLQLDEDDILVCLDSALTNESKFRLRDRCNLSVI